MSGNFEYTEDMAIQDLIGGGQQEGERVQTSNISNIPESVEYTLQAVREYPQMREFCDDFEHTYPVLLRKGKVDTDAFCRTDILSEKTFVMPELAPCDMDKLDVYLSYREKVYLLECGLERMDDTIRPMAESLLFKHFSWEEVMKKTQHLQNDGSPLPQSGGHQFG